MVFDWFGLNGKNNLELIYEHVWSIFLLFFKAKFLVLYNSGRFRNLKGKKTRKFTSINFLPLCK